MRGRSRNVSGNGEYGTGRSAWVAMSILSTRHEC